MAGLPAGGSPDGSHRQATLGKVLSRTGSQTVRRPWCLSCCDELDRDHCDVIRFPR
jgi:hypothetical protein